MNIEEEVKRHSEILAKQDLDHIKFNRDIEEIKEFMANLSGINDVVKGTKLLRTPSLWLLALVIGTVALLGGFKTIIGWFIIK